MTESLCPCVHRKDPERPRRSAPGVRLCAGHLGGLRENIATLPRIHDQLAAYLVSSGGEGHAPKSEAVGIALNADVVKTRDNIRNDLVSWTRIALEEGPWSIPPSDDLRDVAAWLVMRVDWLANQDWSDEIARSIQDTVTEARALVQPNTTYRVEIGPCPEPVVVLHEETGEPGLERCDGTVIAVMQRVTSGEKLPGIVRCTSHGDDEETPHEWGPTQWHALGRRMGRTLNADATTMLIQAMSG